MMPVIRGWSLSSVATNSGETAARIQVAMSAGLKDTRLPVGVRVLNWILSQQFKAASVSALGTPKAWQHYRYGCQVQGSHGNAEAHLTAQQVFFRKLTLVEDRPAVAGRNDPQFVIVTPRRRNRA